MLVFSFVQLYEVVYSLVSSSLRPKIKICVLPGYMKFKLGMVGQIFLNFDLKSLHEYHHDRET